MRAAFSYYALTAMINAGGLWLVLDNECAAYCVLTLTLVSAALLWRVITCRLRGPDPKQMLAVVRAEHWDAITAYLESCECTQTAPSVDPTESHPAMLARRRSR